MNKQQMQLICNCEQCTQKRSDIAKLQFQVAKTNYETSLRKLQEALKAFEECSVCDETKLFFLELDLNALYQETSTALDKFLTLKGE